MLVHTTKNFLLDLLKKKMWESWLMSVEVFEGEYKKHSVFPVRHVAWIEDN